MNPRDDQRSASKRRMTGISLVALALAAGFFVALRPWERAVAAPLTTPVYSSAPASAAKSHAEQPAPRPAPAPRRDAMISAPTPPVPAAAEPAGLSPEQEQQRQVIVANLQRLAAARDQFRLVNGRPATFADLVGAGKLLPELSAIDGEEYDRAVNPTGILHVTTEHGLDITFGLGAEPTVQLWPQELVDLTRASQEKLTPAFIEARNAYRAANNGRLPPSLDAVVPYFTDPKLAADYVATREAQKILVGQIRQISPHP